MELIDRYLQAVKLWLPTRQKQDICCRVCADDLQSQVEEREAELGRPLAETELADLLERCGKPMAAAGRYLSRRSSLIGPRCIPYLMALKSSPSSSISCPGRPAGSPSPSSFRRSARARPGLTLLKWLGHVLGDRPLRLSGAITAVPRRHRALAIPGEALFPVTRAGSPPVRDTRRIPQGEFDRRAPAFRASLLAAWRIDLRPESSPDRMERGIPSVPVAARIGSGAIFTPATTGRC